MNLFERKSRKAPKVIRLFLWKPWCAPKTYEIVDELFPSALKWSNQFILKALGISMAKLFSLSTLSCLPKCIPLTKTQTLLSKSDILLLEAVCPMFLLYLLWFQWPLSFLQRRQSSVNRWVTFLFTSLNATWEAHVTYSELCLYQNIHICWVKILNCRRGI